MDFTANRLEYMTKIYGVVNPRHLGVAIIFTFD